MAAVCDCRRSVSVGGAMRRAVASGMGRHAPKGALSLVPNACGGPRAQPRQRPANDPGGFMTAKRYGA